MSNPIKVKLMCLVQGETLQGAITIKIERTSTVDELKRKIKRRIDVPTNFKSRSLVLWKAFFATTNAQAIEDLKTKTPNSVIQRSVKLENAILPISNLFENDFQKDGTLPAGYIHIVIEKPPCFKSILMDGFPRLGGEIGNRSESEKREQHEDAFIVDSDFTPISGITLSERKSAIWQLYKNEGRIFDYGAEATIVRYVSVVLADIIYAMGKEKELRLLQEITVRQQRHDIRVISFLGLPVGIIEVKKPSNKIMNSHQLGGQVFDFLTILRSFYGIEWPFAIVTTYRQWRFFWLEDTDPIAKLNSVANPGPSFITRELPDIPFWNGNFPTVVKAVDKLPGSQTVVAHRRILASPIIFSHEKHLPVYIASALHKMASTPRKKVDLVDHNRCYIEMDDLSWKWKDLPSELEEVHFSGNLPRSNTKKFICLAYLGSGSEGLVWLATSESGTGCVIKLSSNIRPVPIHLFKSRNNNETEAEKAERKVILDQLQIEARNWKAVWNINAEAKMIGGQPALVMPYLHMCSNEELEKLPIQALARNAVQHMARQGYQHTDLSRRHVGLYKTVDTYGVHLHAILIDLSNIAKIQRKDEVTAVTTMSKDLNL